VTGSPFDDIPPGTPLGPFPVTVSADANRRYYAAAGVAHPALDSGALYPPIAANLTILLFLQTCDAPMIQTRQRLRCHGRIETDTPLVVTGEVRDRYEKRGRAYVDVHATVAPAADPAGPRWESEVSFTPASEVKGRET
jgi:hypothetical protein